MLTYPLLWLSAAFLIGILFGKYISIPLLAWLITAGAFLLLTLVDRPLQKRIPAAQRMRQKLPVAPGLILLIAALGGARYVLSTPPITPANLAWYNDRGEFTLVGYVSAPPDVRAENVRYEISLFELNRFTGDGQSNMEVTGKALVTMPRWQQWQYGDRLMFTGKPLTPAVYPDFSYKDYLTRQGIQSVIYYPFNIEKVGEQAGTGFIRWLGTAREKAREVILSLMPQPESGLLEGILLGLENDMPSSLAQAYRDTGTSHIIAISGFNMTLLATLLINGFSRLFRKYWGVLAAILVIVVYAVFVNGSASVSRAAFMASMAAVAHLVGRRQSGVHALFLAAAAMCLVNPFLPWDVSFQLSFMAVLGLALFGDPMKNGFTAMMEKWFGEEKAARISSPVSEYFLLTLAAQLTTLPVIAIQFKRISLVSLLANPLILPMQPAILEAGAVTTIGGLIHPILGKFCAMFTWPLLAWTNFIVSTFAKIKGASVIIHPLAAFWILLGFLLVLLAFLLRNYFKKQFGSTFTMWLVVLFVAGSFSAWSILAHRPDGKLHVHLIKTGDSSTLFIQTPAGNNLLFDLPGDAGETSAALTPLLSPWDYHVDAILLTRPVNETRLSDLNSMLPVHSVITTNSVLRPAADSHPLSIQDKQSLVVLEEGKPLTLEEGLTLAFIGGEPGKAAYSITWKETTIVIPAGVDLAMISQANPGLFDHPQFLVLTPEDVSYIPARLWEEFNPSIILWNSLDTSPVASSISLEENKRISFTSDGVQIWKYKP
jgi:competence protein ComEC